MSTASSELVLPMQAASVWRRVWDRVEDVVTSIFAVVVAIVAAVAIVSAVATHFSSTGQYTFFGRPVLTVLSGSMTPTIRTGDLIVDRPITSTQAQHLHVGQVITFRETSGSQGIVTHRIVSVTADASGALAYRTKGDANQVIDAELRPASTVVGVFQTRIPDGGYILNALHKPLVLGLLLASPLLWFVAEPLRRWAREEEPDDPAPVAGEAEVGTP